MTVQSATQAKPALRSVSIALDILDAFFADTEIGLSELARRVGVTKSTMHPTCGVLVDRGALERTLSGKYRLGVHLLEYGQLVTKRSALRRQALPLLVDLRNAIGETVQLGVPSGGDVLYFERVEGLGALRSSIEAVRRSPVHRSSAGKAIAAFRPEGASARIKAGMKPFTGHTIVIPGCSSRSSPESASADMRSASTKARSACPPSVCRFATVPTARSSPQSRPQAPPDACSVITNPTTSD